ncbi:MAG TPA: tetratricopeptide repeat protein [Chitinophagaceae bacterium]|nr:tetratricopeptide repeat protein [Chitinophagaceae bacterium]
MRKPVSVLFTFILVHFCFSLNAAGNSPVALSDTSKENRTFAMVMGISTYKYIRPLTYADSDAELFRDFLKSGGGGNVPDSNIYFLKNEDVKAANFFVKGMSWLRNRALKAGDRLYIYLAGHGDAISQDEFFYLTYDCNPAGDKNNYLITGTIQLYNLKVKIAEHSRKGVEVIFIMDACRTNELPGGGEGQEMLTAAISEKQAGEIIMLATGAGQESLEDAAIGTGHGLFTYYLVDGLVGMADDKENPDNLVTMEELQNYVTLTVPNIAQERYKKKQNPFLCCEENKKKIISKVDTSFLRKWILAKQLRGQLRGNEFDAITRNVKTRGIYDVADTSVLDLYNYFNKALKEFNLTGNGNSAESYFQKLNTLAPTSSYTHDAKLDLATEFINFAQSKINLYLEGRDVTSIQRIRSQLDADEKSDEISNSLDRMEKVARQDFSEVAKMLEKAIEYGEIDDEGFRRRLMAKNFFFKAHGYYDKGGSTEGLRQAIRDAMDAYRADPTAAYILNTLSSLELENNKPDSAIYFARKAIAHAPLWRYPYFNIANAYSRKNNSDSALVYFKKALAVDASRADAYVDLGFFYFQQRQLDSAAAYYRKALILDPQNVSANNNMGWLLRESRQFEESISFFKKSLQADPKFFNAYNGISRVFTDLRMYDSARTYYQKAMESYPDKLITNNYMGQFFQEINQVDSARSYFIQAAVYDPNYDAPFINLGKLYAGTKQYDSARYFYRKAIELNGKNFRGYNQLGMMFSDMKQFDSAYYYYRKGLEVNPDNTVVLNNFGLSFYAQELFDSAVRYFRKVISISPQNPYAMNNLGLIFFKIKKLDSAAHYYSKALDLKKDLVSAAYNMGLLLSQLKDYEGAKSYFRKIMLEHPENMDALSSLEFVLKQNNEYDSAIYYYKKTLEKGIRGTILYNGLGRLYFDTEKFDSAARWYNKAIEYNPGNAIGFNNLGAVYTNLLQYDSAVLIYKKALELQPGYFNAQFRLGLVYHNMSYFDSAAVHLEKAVSISPKNNVAYYYLACSYAMNNKSEEALKAIRLALENGYSNYEFLTIEADLQSIRKLPEFTNLLKKYFPKKFDPKDQQ